MARCKRCGSGNVASEYLDLAGMAIFQCRDCGYRWMGAERPHHLAENQQSLLFRRQLAYLKYGLITWSIASVLLLIALISISSTSTEMVISILWKIIALVVLGGLAMAGGVVSGFWLASALGAKALAIILPLIFGASIGGAQGVALCDLVLQEAGEPVQKIALAAIGVALGLITVPIIITMSTKAYRKMSVDWK